MQTKPKAPGLEALLICFQLRDTQQVNRLGFFICKMGSMNPHLTRLGRLHVKCSGKWHMLGAQQMLALVRPPGWATRYHMDLGEAVRFSKISRQKAQGSGSQTAASGCHGMTPGSFIHFFFK